MGMRQSSATKKWFIFNHEVVSGPYTGEQIVEFLAKGRFAGNDLIWSKGHREWINLGDWKLEDLPEEQEQATWYLCENRQTFGPFKFDELIEEIKSDKYSNKLRVWHPSLPKWASVYQIGPVMEALNICRRKHFRAPLSGKIELRNYAGPINIFETASVSAGGLGLKGPHTLAIGEEFSVRFASDSINGSVYAKAKVVYSNDRETGLQFMHISDENKAAVIEYVRQFEVGLLTAA